MMKRLRELFGVRPTRTETTQIETSENPMSHKLLIGVTKYALDEAPRALPEKSNRWDEMSDISHGDCEFLPIDEETATDDEVDQHAVPTDVPEQWIKFDRTSTPLLFTPTTVLKIQQGFFVRSSPDGVEQLDDVKDNLRPDDCSAISDLSSIHM